MGGRGASSGRMHRVPNYKNATIADGKITKYCLDPRKKHYKDFVGVGYSEADPNRLKNDLLKGLSENEVSESTYENEHGERSFTVIMSLGVTKKERFKTIWQTDNTNINPKFITGYRYDRK